MGVPARESTTCAASSSPGPASRKNVQVNGQSVKDIVGTQQLHDLFSDAGRLYRYNSGTSLQGFVHTTSGAAYTPKAGDYLERRGADGAEHSMIVFRWLPGNPSASQADDRLNQAVVINGPWPVTLRLVKIHKDETTEGKDFYLGRWISHDYPHAPRALMARVAPSSGNVLH